MGSVSLDDITVRILKRIPTPGSDILHALNSKDKEYINFGEAYFSSVEYGFVKAWKLQKLMTMNFIVPIGQVRFVFHLQNNFNKYRILEIGEDHYALLSVPPGIWYGFTGIRKSLNLILNITDVPHDSNNIKRKDINECNYKWK